MNGDKLQSEDLDRKTLFTLTTTQVLNQSSTENSFQENTQATATGQQLSSSGATSGQHAPTPTPSTKQSKSSAQERKATPSKVQKTGNVSTPMIVLNDEQDWERRGARWIRHHLQTNTLRTDWWTRTSTNIYTWTIPYNTHHWHTDEVSQIKDEWTTWLQQTCRHACRTPIHLERYDHLYAEGWIWIYTWRYCSTTTRTSWYTTRSKKSKKSKRQTTTYTSKTRDGGACTYACLRIVKTEVAVEKCVKAQQTR